MNQSAERQEAPELDPHGAVGALADGALEPGEAQQMIDLLLNSPDLRAAWEEVHWVGDCLRSEETGALVGRSGFLERFHDVLAAEPTILAPRSQGTPQRRWLRYGAPVAAVAVATAAVWLALPIGTGTLNPQGGAAPQAAAQRAPGVGKAHAVDPGQLHEYLAAHQEFAATALHGPGALQAASFNIVADAAREHP